MTKTKHGLGHTRQWYIWANMKKRCNNKNAFAYERYGGRGIKYDPKWQTFEGFWSDMSEGYDPLMSLERIDNDGDYTYDNCKWIPRSEQSKNQSSNKRVMIGGKERKLFDLVAESGIKYNTLYNRIYVYGIPPEEAIKHKYMRARNRKAKEYYSLVNNY